MTIDGVEDAAQAIAEHFATIRVLIGQPANAEAGPTQTSFNEVSCLNSDDCDWPECDCPRKDDVPSASTTCPICHKSEPHHHSDDEIKNYRQSPALYAEAWRKYYAGMDHHPVYRRIFIEGGLFALYAAPASHAEAEVVRWRQRAAKAEAVLEFLVAGYDNQDINHKDFRVEVYKAAIDALGVTTSPDEVSS